MSRPWKGLNVAWILLSALLGPVYALPCVITVVKSSCWQDYDVTVDIVDATFNTSLSKVTIPKGKAWVRTTFECKPAQVLSANASFSPVIWENQKGQIYKSVRFWHLPDQAPAAGSLWTINMCYPMEFESVPSTLKTSNCECTMDGIPPVENTNVVK